MASLGGRKRREDLWKYYKYIPAERKTECIVAVEGDVDKCCGFKLGGKNTTNLKRHLKNSHAAIYEKVSCLQQVLLLTKHLHCIG